MLKKYGECATLMVKKMMYYLLQNGMHICKAYIQSHAIISYDLYYNTIYYSPLLHYLYTHSTPPPHTNYY